MARRAQNTQLFQLITLENNELRYRAFTAAGELYDAFELKKGKKGINKLTNTIPNTPERLD